MIRVPHDAVYALLPLASLIEVRALGRLYLMEVLLLIALPALLRGRRIQEPAVRLGVVLLLVWLGGQVVSDIYRSSAPEDFLRGWAKIGFTATNFLGLWLLLRDRPVRLRYFLYGLALAATIGALLIPQGHAVGDPWKFGIGIPLSLALVAAARTFAMQTVLLAGLVVLNVVLGFRSLAGVLALALFAHLLARAMRKPPVAPALRLAAGATAMSLVAVGVVATYALAATSGWLGDEAKAKFEFQSQGDLSLLGGRIEMLASSRAIMDSPLLGHGSWARGSEYRAHLVRAAAERGYIVHFSASDDDLIPTHSHLLGAWVEAGVAGSLVWFAVLVLAGRELLTLHRTRWWPLSATAAALLLWDVLFSPFGADRRFVTPLLVIILINARRERGRARATGEAG